MRILLTGARGFVGAAVAEALGGRHQIVAAPSLRETTRDAVRALVDAAAPDAIVHTAAISDTGCCERCPEASLRANVELPVWLAEAAGPARLIVFSSDQVYNGQKEPGPWAEDAALTPSSVYGKHKLRMEEEVLPRCDAVALRAEWMFDRDPPRPTWLQRVDEAILRGGPILESASQYRGITWVRDAAAAVERALTVPAGVYNFGCVPEGPMTETARAYLRLRGLDIPIEDAGPRRSLWMDPTKAESAGLGLGTVTESLARCLGISSKNEV